MGEVYRAWDPRLRREVALKVLHERAATDPARVRQFVAEARAASALSHPNILTVFDADVDGSTPFIVSELIEGSSLREEIRRGPVPVKRVLDLGTQIADGLSEAHAAGIVHRDLKPENIMITRGGRAKILDFGLTQPTGSRGAHGAGRVDGDTITEAGLIAGTVPYMSPEQARGLPTDFRTDQFSFGLVLYEMLTGQAAFRRATAAATLDAIANEDPVPLLAGLPHSPVMLRWIVERCLAKNPAERYGATADLYHDLRMLRDRLAEVLDRERPPSERDRATSVRWRIGAGALLIAAAAAGFIAWRIGANQPRFDLSNLQFRALATDPAYEGLPALSPDGEVVAYSRDVDGILQIFTRRLTSPTAVRVTDCPYDCKHPFWAPDGKRIYYTQLARDRDGIWSIGAAGGKGEVIVENATRGAISPDGRTIAFLRDELRADTIGTETVWLSTPGGTAPWPLGAVERSARRVDKFGGNRFIEGALAFSPDGNALGLCAVPGTRVDRMWQFWLIPLGGGEPERRLQWWTDAGPRISSFSWFPDSRHIALGVSSLSTAGSHLWIADLPADRAWPLTRGADSELYPSTSIAGDRIAFTRGEPDYDLVQVPLIADRSLRRVLLATSHNESDPVLSPDKKFIAYVTDRNGQDEIWRRSVDGTVDEPVITQRDFGDDRTIMLSSPAFSPDGRSIAYQRNGFKPRWPLRIWISLVGGATVPLLPAQYEGIQSAPTWSPDGQEIAFAQWHEPRWELAKVRLGSGQGPVILRTDGVANATPRWSPNGEWITWETPSGLLLVSPDGGQERSISEEQWLVHTWSSDGRQILAIKETEDRRLSLVAVTISRDMHVERLLTDLGASFPFNNPVKGLTLLPGGRTAATSIVRPRGDIWIAQGIRWRTLLSRLLPTQIPRNSENLRLD